MEPLPLLTLVLKNNVDGLLQCIFCDVLKSNLNITYVYHMQILYYTHIWYILPYSGFFRG